MSASTAQLVQRTATTFVTRAKAVLLANLRPAVKLSARTAVRVPSMRTPIRRPRALCVHPVQPARWTSLRGSQFAPSAHQANLALIQVLHVRRVRLASTARVKQPPAPCVLRGPLISIVTRPPTANFAEMVHSRRRSAPTQPTERSHATRAPVARLMLTSLLRRRVSSARRASMWLQWE